MRGKIDTVANPPPKANEPASPMKIFSWLMIENEETY